MIMNIAYDCEKIILQTSGRKILRKKERTQTMERVNGQNSRNKEFSKILATEETLLVNFKGEQILRAKIKKDNNMYKEFRSEGQKLIFMRDKKKINNKRLEKKT